jgi:hypothetical protein
MLSLGLFGVALVGTMFWVVSPEAAVVLYARQHGWHPLAIGAVAAAGQAAAQVLLFAFGAQLRLRWRWFDRQCEKARNKYGARLQRGVVALAATSGLAGVPPISATAALAPGLGLRAFPLVPLTFAMRVVRFTVVAAVALHVARG